MFVSAPLLWAADEQLGQHVVIECIQDTQSSFGGCTRETSGEDCEKNNISKRCTPAGSLYELPISVNLGHDWKGVESTRQLRLFTDPPSGEPIFLKLHVREHR